MGMTPAAKQRELAKIYDDAATEERRRVTRLARTMPHWVSESALMSERELADAAQRFRDRANETQG